MARTVVVIVVMLGMIPLLVQAESHNTTFLAQEKAGACPKSDAPHKEMKECKESCSSDRECSGVFKCCYGPSGCPECVSPVIDTSCKPACQNNGTCNKGLCSCPEGYIGKTCAIAATCYEAQITFQYAPAPSGVQLSIKDASKLVKPIEPSFAKVLTDACNHDITVRFGKIAVANNHGKISISVTAHFQGDTIERPEYSDHYRACFNKARRNLAYLKKYSLPQLASKYPVSRIVPRSFTLDKLCCQPGYTQQNSQCAPCDKGEYHDTAYGVCKPCGLDQYQPKKAQSSCLTCKDGFINNANHEGCIKDGSNPPNEECKISWKKVGCFHDRIIPDRPYPQELVNHRDPYKPPMDPASDGHLMEWSKYAKHLKSLACACAEKSRSKGYRFFGLQYFGECWSGPSATFYRDGKSQKCINGNFKPCDDKDNSTVCVGKAFTNYIYTLEEESVKEETSKWGEWSQWTTCDKKCGGGQRSRERVCITTSSYDVARCEGGTVQREACNEEVCEKVCDKKLEVGVILDGSSSVRSSNYRKVKMFFQNLTDEFKVSKEGVHFGAIHFSWKAHLDFNISDPHYWSPQALRKRINDIDYPFGGTRTDLALEMAEKKLLCAKCGIRGDGVPKVLIVITDGNSSPGSKPMPQATRHMKKDGVTMIAIGVTDRIDKVQLNQIAKDAKHVFLLPDFKYLKDKLNQINKLACAARA